MTPVIFHLNHDTYIYFSLIFFSNAVVQKEDKSDVYCLKYHSIGYFEDQKYNVLMEKSKILETLNYTFSIFFKIPSIWIVAQPVAKHNGLKKKFIRL